MIRNEIDEVAISCLSGVVCSRFANSDWEEDSINDDPFVSFQIPENETDGFSYVLGFTVKKFRRKYPLLAISEHEEELNDWIQFINKA